MSSSSEFARPPPDYTTASTSKKTTTHAPVYGTTNEQDSRKPLLSTAGEGEGQRDAWNEGGELEDDFNFGVNLAQSSQDVRNEFVRKVYSVLFMQILATTAIGWIMSADAIAVWTFQHPAIVFLPLLGVIVSAITINFKYRSSPLNVILLGIFTLSEAVAIGCIIPLYDPQVVLKALVITTFTFLGLTLFTFQTKYDIASFAPYLTICTSVFIVTLVVGIFLPFNSTFDLFVAGAGCLLFSVWIVFDTHLLLKYMHPDQWALACVKLYLDVINLFLQVLRVLSDIQDR